MFEAYDFPSATAPDFHANEDFEALIPDLDALKTIMVSYGFPTVEAAKTDTALFRTLLFYVASKHGSRFAAAWAVTAGLFEHLSHVWLLKCLKDAASFFRAYTKALIQDFPPPTPLKDGWVVMMADATCIRSPQSSTDRYERVQLMWELKTGWLRHIHCPLQRRPGESVGHYPIQKHTLLVADRLYCSLKAFKHTQRKGGALLTRWRRNLGLWHVEERKRFDWKKACQRLSVGQRSVHHVRLGKSARGPVVRLVVCHVGEEFGANERAHIKAQKGKVTADAAFASPYLLIVSTAPEEVFSDAELVELYRLRWRGTEIEIREAKSGQGFSGVVGKRVGVRRSWLWAHLCSQVLWQRFESRLAPPPPEVEGCWGISWVRQSGWYLKLAGQELMLRALIPMRLSQWPEVRSRFLRAFRTQLWRKKRPRAFEAFLRAVDINFDAAAWRNAHQYFT